MAAHPTRKDDQPYAASRYQRWATSLIDAQHEEALYAFGELCLYTLMWRPVDFERGLVARCPVCFGGATSRQAAAFQQATRHDCPSCYGTTFAGGIRAQIVRPTIFADRNQEMNDEARGVVEVETLQIETTSDFIMRKSDFVFRFDNTRYQSEEKREAIVRDGFSPPLPGDSFMGSATVHREEQSAMAFTIPPTSATALATLLGVPGPFTVSDITAMDDIKPGGYLL